MKALAVLAVVLVVLNGCASIISPGPDRVMVSTNPDAAKIYLDGYLVGATPMVIQVDRSSAGQLKFTKTGYRDGYWVINKPINGWFFGNVIFGFCGLVGIVIDAATGNITKYSTAPIMVGLVSN